MRELLHLGLSKENSSTPGSSVQVVQSISKTPQVFCEHSVWLVTCKYSASEWCWCGGFRPLTSGGGPSTSARTSQPFLQRWDRAGG